MMRFIGSVVAVSLLVACGGGNNANSDAARTIDAGSGIDTGSGIDAGSGSIDADVSNVVVTISGGVLDSASYTPIVGATVKLPDGSTVMTGNDGRYTASVASASSYVLTIDKSGYAESFATIRANSAPITNATLRADAVLTAVAQTATFDQAVGSTVSTDSGATVVFPPSAFITKTGQTVSGAVTVNLSPIDPFAQTQAPALPGIPSATRSNGDTGALSLYSVMDISASAAGHALTLHSGMSATVSFPIDDNAIAPDTIGLWSLDTTTGTWKEEGTATRQNAGGKNYYIAQITHLSWWAAGDFQTSSVTISGNMTSTSPQFHLDGTGYAVGVGTSPGHALGSDEDFANGQPGFSSIVPANSTVIFQLSVITNDQLWFVSYPKTITTPASGNVDVGDVQLVFAGNIFSAACAVNAYPCNNTCLPPLTACVVDPCNTNNGGCENDRTCSETTVGTESFVSCGACPAGDIASSATACAKVTCATNGGDCDSNATCSDSDSGPVCTCNAGFTGDGKFCNYTLSLTGDATEAAGSAWFGTATLTPDPGAVPVSFTVTGDHGVTCQVDSGGNVICTGGAAGDDITLTATATVNGLAVPSTTTEYSLYAAYQVELTGAPTSVFSNQAWTATASISPDPGAQTVKFAASSSDLFVHCSASGNAITCTGGSPGDQPNIDVSATVGTVSATDAFSQYTIQPGTAPACNTLDVSQAQVASQIDFMSAPPAATGGAIAPATYYLSSVSYYDAASSGIHTGDDLYDLIELTGSGPYTVQGNNGAVYTATWTPTDSTTLHIVNTCGAADDESLPYTSDDNPGGSSHYFLLYRAVGGGETAEYEYQSQ